NILRSLVTEGPYQYSNDALGNDGITIRGKNQFIVFQFGMDPNLALTALDYVILCLILFLDHWKRFSKLYHIFIALHPILEHGKFIYDFLLYFLYSHI